MNKGASRGGETLGLGNGRDLLPPLKGWASPFSGCFPEGKHLEEGVVSGLSLVELLRLSLKGVLGREDAELLLKAIPAVCLVVWPDWAIGERAARLSHGLYLPLVDALVLATALAALRSKQGLKAGAKELWTTDADLARYEGKLRVVLLTSQITPLKGWGLSPPRPPSSQRHLPNVMLFP